MVRALAVSILTIPLLFIAFVLGQAVIRFDYARNPGQLNAASAEIKAGSILLLVFVLLWIAANFGWPV